ncbi:enoyl hydratase isomerase family [Fusarium pseudocircinatum]|uniref:Enoyl hydratase isomerase family n=1 Tax=Fusarium pseudocircinatum TaxID=56676 RepID=A0A8H5USV0_9HYPO|nr:enoyl hydratase isomerase family [Fusarium pseudocircinatum]
MITHHLLDLAPPLLPTEQIGPNIWVRNMFFFELPVGYDIDALSEMLRVGYRNLKNNVPLIGCEVIPAGNSRAGMSELRHYGDENLNDFTVKDFRADATCPSFVELKAQGYPSAALDPERFCTRGLGGEWPQPGDRVTVSLMQANFIRGGLILNMSFLHVCCDQTTVFKFMEVLSDELRRAQGLAITDAAEVHSEDRETIMKISGNKKEICLDHAEYVILESNPSELPPLMTKDIHHGHVWYLSPESLVALKEEASPKNARILKHETLPSYISTTDALTALIWRSTMVAQHSETLKTSSGSLGCEAPCSGGPSQVAIALDLRRRSGRTIQKHTLGNIFGFAPAILDLNQVIHEASLADLAILVRRAIEKAEDVYLGEINTIVDGLNDVSCLVPTCMLDMPGKNILQTSWREFPFYDLEWGDAFGGNIKALRPPSCGLMHGVQVMLPDPKRGGCEVWVGVEDSSMDRLMADPLWRAYVEIPTAT